MARIWPVYKGREPFPPGGPWAELPVSEAVDLFELKPADFKYELAATPRFGKADRELWYLGYKRVLVEIDRNEGRKANWKPGYYMSPVKPKDAFGRLIEQALTSELRAENVIRVLNEPTIDSQGQDALKITVVIAPDAIDRLAKGASLNALVRLQERLAEMGDNRTPIVEYATEAELAEDVSP